MAVPGHTPDPNPTVPPLSIFFQSVTQVESWSVTCGLGFLAEPPTPGVHTGYHVLVCVCVWPSIAALHWAVDMVCVLGPRKGLWAVLGCWLLWTREP